jgi:hypothetical protein
MMRIRIEDVIDPTRGQVRFRCGRESVKGYWAGPGEVPVGLDLDIEMEVSEERIISARPASPASPDSLKQDGGVVVISGLAERVGTDGIIEFRVGQDVVLLERSGRLADVVEGAYFELRVPDLKIYPINL